MPASDKKNYVIALLACTTAGMGALLLQTRNELAEVRKAPTMTVTRSEFTTAAAPAPIETPAAPAAIPAPPPAEPAAEQRPEGGPPNQGGQGGRGARFMAQMTELMKDPEFAAALKIEQEARIEQRYGAMFKDLSLPPEKLATLKTLLVERENAGREVFASAAAQGLNPRENRDELRQLAEDLRSEVDSNIEAQLGASVVTAIDTYNSTSSQRNTVNDLSQKLTISGQTLNSSQAKQLTTILAETGTQQGRGNTIITDATITRATAVLTGEQIAALKSLQEQQKAQQVVEEMTRAAREAAGGGGGGGGGMNMGNWRGGNQNRN